MKFGIMFVRFDVQEVIWIGSMKFALNRDAPDIPYYLACLPATC